MVDYNNESTISTPSVDVMRIQILERRAYVIEAYETYIKHKMSGVKGNTQTFRSRLISLFWEIQGTLRRRIKKEEYLNIIKKLMQHTTKIEEILEIWVKLNTILDDIHLTRIDVRKNYDTTDVEEENSVHGL